MTGAHTTARAPRRRSAPTTDTSRASKAAPVSVRTPASRRSAARAVRRFVAFALLLATFAVLALGHRPDRAFLAATIQQAGGLGPALAVVGTAVLAAGLVPRALLAVAGGLIFGPWYGSLYVLVGVIAGGTAAFGVGRLLGRDFIVARLGSRLEWLDGWVGRHGFGAVVAVRMAPVLPFGVASYAFGCTAVRLGQYVTGTAIGAAPSTVAYAVAAGAALDGSSMGYAVGAASSALLAVTVVAVVVRRRLILAGGLRRVG